MTWQEIYNKYKDSELMKEFMYFYLPFHKSELDCYYNETIGGHTRMAIEEEIADLKILKNIKDIWGYLICFAETKQIYINLEWATLDRSWYGFVVNESNHFAEEDGDDVEQAMLWCADKFFE